MRFGLARGAGLVDFNLDGLVDLVQVIRNENVALWRNVGSGTRPSRPRWASGSPWASSKAAPNRDAIGSWLEVRIGDRRVQREVTVGGGHAGGQLGWIHVGLGTADAAEVRVTWPDGETGPWLRVPADGFTLLDRESAAATAWTP